MTETLPDLVKLVNYLGYHIDSAKSDVNQLYDLYNLAFIPEDMTVILTTMLGYPLDNTTELEFNRRNLLKIIDKYKNKGTKISFNDLMNELDYVLNIQPLWTQKQEVFENTSIV
jgi:hypothetical protein